MAEATLEETMNIGDLVTDDWGDLAIIIAQVGVVDRWVIQYVESQQRFSMWGSNLFPIRS